jgi:hypothetical protein
MFGAENPTVADAYGAMIVPPHGSEFVFKGGPYTYVRRSLPGPGQEADAFYSFAPLSFSPIGPTFVNQRQVVSTTPLWQGYKTLGVQVPGVQVAEGSIVSQALISNPLSDLMV